MTQSLPTEQLQQLFAAVPGLRLAYLFGSRVQGNVGPMSDYDFAVLANRDVDKLPFQSRLAHELAVLLATDRIDVILLNDAPVELAYAVIAQGKVLYQADLATRVDYEARILGLYGDYLPVLRAQRKAILQGETSGARIQRYRAAFERTQRTLDEIRAASEQNAN